MWIAPEFRPAYVRIARIIDKSIALAVEVTVVKRMRAAGIRRWRISWGQKLKAAIIIVTLIKTCRILSCGIISSDHRINWARLFDQTAEPVSHGVCHFVEQRVGFVRTNAHENSSGALHSQPLVLASRNDGEWLLADQILPDVC